MAEQFPAPAGRINIEQLANGDGLVGLARHRRASVVSSRSVFAKRILDSIIAVAFKAFHTLDKFPFLCVQT